ncbi:MAG: hypothetical protein K2X66_15685 [Cyanobacteria bacterium]|nr:hypothetical protein [Cyanobacteriota bacterium]
MMDSYPLAMLNEKYARLAPPKTFQEKFSTPINATGTLISGVVHKEANDASLAEMEDSFKRGGSLLIATLATLGAANKILGVGEFLGFASWFGAMAVTPKIINGLIWLRTGVNLNQEYINTQGIRQPLYKDRKYLPLNLLPDERIHFIADRLGIPKGIPDRRRLTEEKISQISVQGRTWWMLMAGPATPVISGLVCDLLQDKIAGAINAVSCFYHRNIGMYQATAQRLNKDDLARHLDQYVEQKIGENGNSQLSRWWKNFGSELVYKMELPHTFGIREVIDPVSRKVLNAKLAETIEKIGKTAEKETTLSTVSEFLQGQTAYLTNLKDELTHLIGKYYEKGVVESLSPEKYSELMDKVKGRILNATVTVDHYTQLLNVLKGNGTREAGIAASQKEIQVLLEKPILAEIQSLLEKQQVDQARALLGSPKLFEEIRSLLSKGHFQTAFNHLGASPGQHLVESLQNVMLRKLWRTRMIAYLGGGMLLATWLYTQYFVGKNFSKTEEAYYPSPDHLDQTHSKGITPLKQGAFK